MNRTSKADATYTIKALSLDKMLAELFPENGDDDPPEESLIKATVMVFNSSTNELAPDGTEVTWRVLQLSFLPLHFFDGDLKPLAKDSKTETVTTETRSGLATVYVGCESYAIGQLSVQAQNSTDTFPAEVVFSSFDVPENDPIRQKDAPTVPLKEDQAVDIPFLYDPGDPYKIDTQPVMTVIGTRQPQMVATYLAGMPGADGLIDVFPLEEGVILQFPVPYAMMNADQQQDNRLQYLLYSYENALMSHRGVFPASGIAQQMPAPRSPALGYSNPVYKWDQLTDLLTKGSVRDGVLDFLVPFWPGYNPNVDVDVTFKWYVNGWFSETTPHAKTITITQKASAWGEDPDKPGNLHISVSADAVADYGPNEELQQAQSWITFTVGNLYVSPAKRYYVDFSSDARRKGKPRRSE